MDDIIDTVFADADSAHKAHLASLSYAEHMALGEFYVDVREALDALVESAIGLDIEVPTAPANMIEIIEAGLIELSDQRDQFCQGNNTLLNLFDELTGVYTKALYKLKRLK